MKKLFAALVFALAAALALPASAQTAPTPTQPANVTYNISAGGCPATLVDALTAPFATATAAAASNTAEAAFVVALQAQATAQIAWYVTNAPHVLLQVHITRNLVYGPTGIQMNAQHFTITQLSTLTTTTC